jgi:hypothetical protein
MLCEIAITPDVFGACDGMQPEARDLCLRQLKEFAFDAAIIRNLFDGSWLRSLEAEYKRTGDLRAKEILEKLYHRKRLRSVPPCTTAEPFDDSEWCHEALKSGKVHSQLTGIITTTSTYDTMRAMLRASPEERALLAKAKALSSAEWWKETKPAVRLNRQMNEYLRVLRVTLECSSHVAFIDPYIDPKKPGYKEFLRLVLTAKWAREIEIHRSGYLRDGHDKTWLSAEKWKNHFRFWDEELRSHELRARVCLWPDMHDRYLITNLTGIVLPYGFDIALKNSHVRTTWCRLPSDVRDEVEKEFFYSKAQESFFIGSH